MASLEARDRKFFLKGKEIVLLSGAMHYFRIHPEYWKDRLLRLKACGLNCVETYMPWNKHEELPEKFNYEGFLNVRRYVQLAHELGLYVIIRPGPYICAEWDFGGLPGWLLRDPEMKVRTSYKPYLEAVDRYLKSVTEQLADLQMNKGGPIIAWQLENEYGSYEDDLQYKEFLRDKYRQYGVTELLFTSDNGTGIQRGDVPGELVTANFQEQEHGFLMFEYLKNVKQPDKPLMVMEFWTGWFDHWSEKHHIWPLEEFQKVLTWILQQGSSVNFYMFHGGTNFGFMNGANEGLGATNENTANPYQADVTSYDYDAPVAENGDLTPKFYKIRDIIKKLLPGQVSDKLPDPPAAIPSTCYGRLEVKEHLTFADILSKVQPLKTEKVLSQEMLDVHANAGQNHGFTLYRTKVGVANSVTIQDHPRDRAILYLNQKEVEVVDFLMKDHVTNLNSKAGENTLDILVENLSRVNYAEFKSPVLNNQRKGLVNDVLVDKEMVKKWEIFPLEFQEDFINSLDGLPWKPGKPEGNQPSMSRVELEITEPPQDTFINMKGWTKGVVFVNGFNLGRYWNIGPQETLYIPGPLLHEGKNNILIFEVHTPADSVAFDEKTNLGEPVIHSTELTASFKALVFTMKNSLRLGPWVWNFWKLWMK